MAEYFTVDSVRDQLLQIGEVNSDFVPGSFPADWHYCPCVTEIRCQSMDNLYCVTPIRIGVFVKTPYVSIPAIIEIIYAKNSRNGYVRVNQMKLQQLLKEEIIDEQLLEKVIL